MEEEREVEDSSMSPNFEIPPTERSRSSSQKRSSSLERDRSEKEIWRTRVLAQRLVVMIV